MYSENVYAALCHLLSVLTAKENIIMPLLLDKKQPDETYLALLTKLVVITRDSRVAQMADRQFVIVDGVLSEAPAK